jgi:hypothetical protein
MVFIYSSWPFIADSFFFPQEKLPTSFNLVGLAVGKSNESTIKLFSAIPIPALTLQYIIPRGGASDLPLSFGTLTYQHKKPTGVEVPLISTFPISLHCGTVRGNVFDTSVKKPLQASASIYNIADKVNLDIKSNSTSDVFVELDLFDVVNLAAKLIGYNYGFFGIVKLVEFLQLGKFQVDGAPWVGEALSEWRLPLIKFYPGDEPEESVMGSENDVNFSVLLMNLLPGEEGSNAREGETRLEIDEN